MFIFLYVEEEKVLLQENMYALKHAWMHYAIEIFKEVQQNFKVSQDWHKSYADIKRTWREFNIGDHVYLKVKVEKECFEFGKMFKAGT